MSGHVERGLAFRGTVWPGGDAPAFDGVVLVDGAGRIARMGCEVDLPEGCRIVGWPGSWVGPGLVDAHVHLAFGRPEDMLAGGVVAVRDLGAPPQRAWAWRTGPSPPPGWPIVAVSGPVFTAPGGYPSRSWGADGYALFIADPTDARAAVRQLSARPVDLVKVALEPRHGWPVPDRACLAALVQAAHDEGLAVSAHALTASMVARALDAGVDELAHTPAEPLPPRLVERLATAGITIVSTLHTSYSDLSGAAVMDNARALHASGVQLVYGTDLGNTGTRPGADPRELDRLAEAGLGRLGALRAATEGSASVAGIRGRTGRLVVGAPGALVVLPADPLVEPGVWRCPLAVFADGRLTLPPPADGHRLGSVSDAPRRNRGSATQRPELVVHRRVGLTRA